MNSKFIFNLITSVSAYLITGFSSLWIAPIVIDNIGVDAYGLIPLVQMTINFMSIITMAFTSMIARFYTISKTQNNSEESESYISTSFYTMLVLCGLIMLIVIFLGYNIEYVINVPKNLINDARWLFITQGIAFIFLTINVTFQAIPYCNNKLYINNISNTISAFLRAVLIIILMTIFTPYICYTGISTIIGNIVALIIGYFTYKKLEPNIKFKLSKFSFKKLKEMIGLGAWQAINYAGSLFYLQSDIIVSNWNLGTIIAGEYSTLIQWSSLIRAFGNSLSAIFSPTYVRLYAQKKYDEIVKYSNRATTFVGIVVGIMAGFLCGSGDSLLRVWIGSHFEKNSYLLSIMALSLALNVCISPLFALLTTYKKVKIPAIFQILIGIFNFVIGYIITGPMKKGILGLVVVSFISYSLINSIFMPLYVAKITKQRFYAYYYGIIKSLISFCVASIICGFMNNVIYINGWVSLIISGIISLVIYSIFILFCIIDKDIRLRIYRILKMRR